MDTLKGQPALLERVIRLEAVSEAHNRYLSRISATLDKVSDRLAEVSHEQAGQSSTIHIMEQHMSRDHHQKDM